MDLPAYRYNPLSSRGAKRRSDLNLLQDEIASSSLKAGLLAMTITEVP
jgi:hypothetical protein